MTPEELAGHFRIERKGRVLVFRAEVGRTEADRYVVDRIEMGVRYPPDAAGQLKAQANLLSQVLAVYHRVIWGGGVPRHLTADRHLGRRIAVPKISPELKAQLETPLEETQ